MPRAHTSLVTRLGKLGFINVSRTTVPARRRIRPRGVPAALVDAEVFCTESPIEAERLAGLLLGQHRLTVVDQQSTEPFQAALHAIRLRDVTLAHLDYHHAAHLDFPATGDHYTVILPTSGQMECCYAGREVTCSTYQAIVVNPHTRLQLSLAVDTPLLVVRIEVDALHRQLSRMLGRSIDHAVQFAPEMLLTAGPAVRWHGAIQLLSSEAITSDSLVQQGIGVGPIEELVISTLLWVQDSSTRAELVDVSPTRGGATVRAAVSYIEEHLADPVTLTEIARHTNRSARSIQQAFHDDLGTTPMAYVRDRRLERARSQLADAVPSDGVTVTVVAHRWGFSHLGHFSAAYLKRFGESPSSTLRG